MSYVCLESEHFLGKRALGLHPPQIRSRGARELESIRKRRCRDWHRKSVASYQNRRESSRMPFIAPEVCPASHSLILNRLANADNLMEIMAKLMKDLQKHFTCNMNLFTKPSLQIRWWNVNQGPCPINSPEDFARNFDAFIVRDGSSIATRF